MRTADSHFKNIHKNWRRGTKLDIEVSAMSDMISAYGDCFVIGKHSYCTNQILIPFTHLDDHHILQSIDLSRYLYICAHKLRQIYDLQFRKSKRYIELRNYILQDEIQ